MDRKISSSSYVELYYSIGDQKQDLTENFGLPALIAPLDLGTTRYSCSLKGSNWTGKVTSRDFLIVPAQGQIARQIVSWDRKELTLLIKPALIQACSAEHSLETSDISSSLQEFHLGHRTTWIAELMLRLTFEHLRCQRTESLAAQFCSVELLKEIYYLVAANSKKVIAFDSPRYQDPIIQRAIAYIEAKLPEAIALSALAKAAACSPATLSRRFKKETGMPPLTFMRNRRLEKAHALLLAGHYAVGDIALMVGYEDFSAFSAAFKRKYQKLPSAVMSEALMRIPDGYQARIRRGTGNDPSG